uniref:Uncharacterized protein n=1 Tax=Anguilla anguilla TaxID=7936 RepID=A0A0E9UMN2_ANGAN
MNCPSVWVEVTGPAPPPPPPIDLVQLLQNGDVREARQSVKMLTGLAVKFSPIVGSSLDYADNLSKF